jgi:hypothetical protein
VTSTDDGWVVMLGELPDAPIVSVTVLLVTLPAVLDTTTQ